MILVFSLEINQIGNDRMIHSYLNLVNTIKRSEVQNRAESVIHALHKLNVIKMNTTFVNEVDAL